MVEEIPVHFACEGSWLYGILHRSDGRRQRGLLIVVGGPQYRVGSHRQFVLLARSLAAAGIPVLRFDYRGMGDSEGQARGFEDIHADIRSAIDAFFRHVPEMRDVALWGLCDAASAALFYAPTDARVSGVALLNPWVRTEEGVARTYLRHYYLRRLAAPGFWRDVLRGKFRPLVSARSFINALLAGAGLRSSVAPPAVNTFPASRDPANAGGGRAGSLPQRMLAGMEQFNGRVLLILSGDDLTASEFKDLVAGSRPWRRLLQEARVSRRDLPGAPHTFSRSDWRARVEQWTEEWIRSW